MKHLRVRELDLVRGGQGEEFRTIQIHGIPRFENPPISLTYESHRSRRPCGFRPLRPMPMHWSPPDASGPQEY